MANFWDWLFGRKDEPARQTTNNASSARSARPSSPQPVRAATTTPTLSSPGLVRGGGGGGAGGGVFAMSAPTREATNEEESPLEAAQRRQQEFFNSEAGQKYLDELPQINQGYDRPKEDDFLSQMGQGQIRQAEAQVKPFSDAISGVDDWFTRSLQDASTPINAEPLSVTAKRIEDRQLRNDADDRLLTEGWNGSISDISQDELRALNPRQQAAVQFNTLLQQAVEADLADTGKADDEYSARVNALFGEEGGSERFAPRTVALLETLGLGDAEAGDLDNYLDRRAFITDAELEQLGDPNFNSSDDPRLQNALVIEEATRATLSQTLAKGQDLIDSLRAGNSMTPELFGEPSELIGADPQNNERDFYLDALFNRMNQPDATPEEISIFVGDIERELGVTPEQTAEYISRRLDGVTYARATGGGDSTFLDPAQLRAKYLLRTE